MKFSVQVNASPFSSSAGLSAFNFIEAALQQQHEVIRVFFYHDAIYHALNTQTPPDDELAWTKKWSDLAACHAIDLVICISAAQRRGLLCRDECIRQAKKDDNLVNGFRISGLGQLLEAMLEADRHIIFT